ncbi:MAG TPA: hypothetical protein EYP32_00660, partial [Aquificaceae bacterium]|nr:hypothetical protein [Aquificaceae bacterium]
MYLWPQREILLNCLSIHTWPEEAHAAIEIYTCGDSYPEIAVDFIL